jgi:RAD51-like protein 1
VVPELDLVELVGLGLQTVRDVVLAAATATTPTPCTAAELRRLAAADAHRFLATGLPAVDVALRGGLCVGTITEITGPSGCGKTQFCTMMATLAAAGGGGGGGAATGNSSARAGRALQQQAAGSVIYIDTEGAFSAERLVRPSFL